MLLLSGRVSSNSTIESKSDAPLHRLESPKEGAPADPECNSLLKEEVFPPARIGLENFHITMKFLGEVSRGGVEQIEEIMSEVAARTQYFQLLWVGLVLSRVFALQFGFGSGRRKPQAQVLEAGPRGALASAVSSLK
ncbi:MAG: hypothetical protein Ct9H300mP15_09410 [Gemmatimonadota bacterium]|nr:MAG: hypothetical protein Ct9H300mP15_09410 [Gemmatimonadota bacterium]